MPLGTSIYSQTANKNSVAGSPLASPRQTPQTPRKQGSRPANPIIYEAGNSYASYSLYKVKVAGSAGLEKVSVSKDFARVYCTSKKIHILENPTKGKSKALEGSDFEGKVVANSAFGNLRLNRSACLWDQKYAKPASDHPRVCFKRHGHYRCQR